MTFFVAVLWCVTLNYPLFIFGNDIDNLTLLIVHIWQNIKHHSIIKIGQAIQTLRVVESHCCCGCCNIRTFIIWTSIEVGNNMNKKMRKQWNLFVHSYVIQFDLLLQIHSELIKSCFEFVRITQIIHRSSMCYTKDVYLCIYTSSHYIVAIHTGNRSPAWNQVKVKCFDATIRYNEREELEFNLWVAGKPNHLYSQSSADSI